MDNRKQLGTFGEEKAAEFLARNGYRILARNFRSRAGELDIVAEEDGSVVFVEVKTRSSDAFGRPEEAVNYFKRKKMIDTARYYLHRNNLANRDCRFDVVSVKLGANENGEISLFRNAFEIE